MTKGRIFGGFLQEPVGSLPAVLFFSVDGCIRSLARIRHQSTMAQAVQISPISRLE